MRFKTLTGATRTVKKSKNFLIDWDGKSRSKIQFNVKQYLKKYWANHIVFEEFPVAGTKLSLDFYNANKHFLKLKSENKKIFTIEIKNINHINDIPKSDSMFNSTYFPDKLQKVINDESNYSITFTFKLQDRNIKVNMIISEQETLFDIEKYEKYMENIYIWFYIASQHAYKYCSKNLHIYIYLTDVKRQLPSSNIHILDAININGGISNVCVQNSISEIVIYRKEEWFKVLIHETFHNYGLDFSDLMINSMKEKVKNLFPIQSNMELFEAYTEFWGEIINMGFICWHCFQ